jgi:Holliday junction resolvase RusA-like endonuclease
VNGIELVVAGRPEGKGRARHGQGRTWTPRRTVLAEREVRAAWQVVGSPRLEGPVALDLDLVVVRPRGHFTARGALSAEGRRHPLPHRTKPDADNALKLVMDALNTRGWRDDVQVVSARVSRRWGEWPHTRLTVRPALAASDGLAVASEADGARETAGGAQVRLEGGANGRRDRGGEARFLAAAARGHDAFAEHAAARLEAGEVTHGDSWVRRGAGALLGELLEEAADLGAWGALTVQAPDLEDWPAADRDRIVALLELAAASGARAHEALAAARGLVARVRVS